MSVRHRKEIAIARHLSGMTIKSICEKFDTTAHAVKMYVTEFPKSSLIEELSQKDNITYIEINTIDIDEVVMLLELNQIKYDIPNNIEIIKTFKSKL